MSWMLRHAVLPLAVAYAVFAFVLLTGERTTRGRRGRNARTGGRGSFGGIALYVVSLAAGGYGAFASFLAVYCAGQNRPGRCLVPALSEAGLLAAAVAVPGLLALEAASRLKR